MSRVAARSFVVCLAFLTLSSTASAQINWNVTYADGNIGVGGKGFADPTVVSGSTAGQLRRDSVNAAFTYLNTVLDGRGTVELTFEASLSSGTGFLASFGPENFVGINGSFQNGGVYQAARTNQRPFAAPDGSGTFNFGYGWNYVGQAPNGSNFDMVTVAIHEIGHGLGFLSATSSTGQGLSGSTLGTPDVYSGFDRYLQKGNGTGGGLLNTTISSSNFGSFTGDVNTLVAGNEPPSVVADRLFFGGQYTREVLNGPMQLYAPTTYEDGSSTSHVFDPGAVMNPSVTPDTVKRLKPYEIAMLMDIGWNVYNWNDSTANWLDGANGPLDVTLSKWQTDLGIVYNGVANGGQIFNINSSQGQAPILPPSGQVTSNIVLNFGSGASAYTATNDIGTLRLARLNLSNNAGHSNTITDGTLNFGLNSDGTASVLAPKIVQNGSGAFTIASNIVTNNVASYTTSAPLEIVTFPGSPGLTIDGTGSGRVTISGTISGGISSNGGFNSTTTQGSLTKAGANFTLVLTGNNTYDGGTTINAGTLLVNGQSGTDSGTGPGAVTVNNGGTFGGTGRAAGTVTVNNGGNLAPGDNGVGTLTLGSGLTLNSGSTFTVELNGNLAANYDSLSVTGGSVELGDATLTSSLGGGYTPGASDKLFVIVNSPGVSVTGTFNGLAQGDSFLIGATTAYISYTGDSLGNTATGGNDVVILFSPVPVPEPGAIIGIAVAALGLGRLVRRRKKAEPELAA